MPSSSQPYADDWKPCCDPMRATARLLIPTLLLTACAQVGELSGGEKDSSAPRLLRSIPEQAGTGFSGDRILLEFDERIQLDRVRDRLLVSPPLSTAPTVRLSGARSVEILLNAPLEEDRTYTFSIGEAVKDLTEGNQASGLDLVFSTGDVLDSLNLAGSVLNAFSGRPEKDVLVVAYLQGDTASFRSGRPLYATRSDQLGQFVLRHLRAGSYELHALRDQNTNYRYDLPNEEIALLDRAVVPGPLDSTITAHVLRLFPEPSTTQRVREYRVEPDGAFRVTLALPAQQAKLRDIARTGGSLNWTTEWSTRRDTVMLWPSDTTALKEGNYELALDGVAVDTLRYRPLGRMPFNTSVRVRTIDEGRDALVKMISSRPIVSYDTARMTLSVDSVPLAFTVERDSVDQRTLTLRSALRAGDNARLTLLPKAVRDIYGGSNDTLVSSLGRAADKATGTLRIAIVTPTETSGSYILALMDAQGRAVRSDVLSNGGTTLTWERIPPGTYEVRCIADADLNGRWDEGSLAARRMPEMVFRHPDPVNVRAGWDLRVDWVLP